MLMMRQAQIVAFEQAAVRNFKDRALRHLQEQAPLHSRILGEAGMRATISYGMTRAAGHGFTSVRSVLMYLDLMMMLCRDFDRDPQLPFAQRILHDPRLAHESIRIDRLHQEARAYLERIAGPDNRYLLGALRKVPREPVADWLPTASDRPERCAQHLMASLHAFYPEKFNYLQTHGVRRLIQRASLAAGDFGFVTGPGVALYVGLTFMLGTHFVEDPLFSWASDVLNDHRMREAQKTEQLYAATLASLEQWLPAA